MKVNLGKVETVTQEVINDEGEKLKMPFLKLSIYVSPEEFGDALSYNKADMFLYRNQAEANEGEVIISADLKEQLKTLFKSGFDVLDSI